MVVIATRASAPATVQSTGGSDRIVFATLGLTLLQYTFPLREKSRRGNCVLRGSQFLLTAFPHPRICAHQSHFLAHIWNIVPATINAARDEIIDSVGAPVSWIAKGFSISAPELRPCHGKKTSHHGLWNKRPRGRDHSPEFPEHESSDVHLGTVTRQPRCLKIFRFRLAMRMLTFCVTDRSGPSP